MMPTCREITRLLASDQLEHEALTRRMLIRLHLMMCDDCTRYAKELTTLGEIAREALKIPLDPKRLAELERAILDRGLRGDAGGAR